MRPLDQELANARSVLFLCSGNIIRSAFCELFARHLDIGLEVRSAGTRYFNDELWHDTRRALTSRGVTEAQLARFCPTHLSRINEIPKHELVFGMTSDHLVELESHTNGARHGYLLGELIGSGEIADPMFAGGFEQTFAVLDECVRRLVQHVAERPPGAES